MWKILVSYNVLGHIFTVLAIIPVGNIARKKPNKTRNRSPTHTGLNAVSQTQLVKTPIFPLL